MTKCNGSLRCSCVRCAGARRDIEELAEQIVRLAIDGSKNPGVGMGALTLAGLLVAKRLRHEGDYMSAVATSAMTLAEDMAETFSVEGIVIAPRAGTLTN